MQFSLLRSGRRMGGRLVANNHGMVSLPTPKVPPSEIAGLNRALLRETNG